MTVQGPKVGSSAKAETGLASMKEAGVKLGLSVPFKMSQMIGKSMGVGDINLLVLEGRSDWLKYNWWGNSYMEDKPADFIFKGDSLKPLVIEGISGTLADNGRYESSISANIKFNTVSDYLERNDPYFNTYSHLIIDFYGEQFTFPCIWDSAWWTFKINDQAIAKKFTDKLKSYKNKRIDLNIVKLVKK